MARVRVRRKSALQYIAVHPHNSSIYLDKGDTRQYVSTRRAGSSLELPAEAVVNHIDLFFHPSCLFQQHKQTPMYSFFGPQVVSLLLNSPETNAAWTQDRGRLGVFALKGCERCVSPFHLILFDTDPFLVSKVSSNPNRKAE